MMILSQIIEETEKVSRITDSGLTDPRLNPYTILFVSYTHAVKRLWSFSYHVLGFTLNLHDLKMMMVESFP